MFRTTDIVLIGLMVAAAGFTYKTKHDAENRMGEIRRIEAQIRLEEDSINVLQADWSLMTQPARLQRLSEVYAEQLELGPIDPYQIGSIAELPMRPLEIEDIIGMDMGTTASINVDPPLQQQSRPASPAGSPALPSAHVPVPTPRVFP